MLKGKGVDLADSFVRRLRAGAAFGWVQPRLFRTAGQPEEQHVTISKPARDWKCTKLSAGIASSTLVRPLETRRIS